MTKRRIKMEPKDLATVINRSPRTGQRKWPKLLKFVGKKREHVVIVEDIALFVNLPVEVVIEKLFGKE